MRIDTVDMPVFAGYAEPLRGLERVFKKSGLSVSFYLINHSLFGKMVMIQRGRAETSISIEGDSPAQAVKDVARAVKL